MDLKEVIHQQDDEIDNGSITTWADMEDICPVSFAWEPWLPKGLLTMITAESGVGKSALALRLVGSYLLGLPWPDNTPFREEQGAALWCEAESAQGINRDRAKEWGYPLEKLYTPFTDPFADVNLDNSSHREIIANKAALPEVKVVVVDSLSGATGKNDKDADIKPVVEWYARLARDIQKPSVLTHHFRKRSVTDSGIITLDRVRGSTVIVQYARVVWALDAPDPYMPDSKRIQMIKNNIARFAEPLGFYITEAGVNFSEDAPQVLKEESQVDKAADLLFALLSNGRRKVNELESEFSAAGISWRSAIRAKKREFISSTREPDGWYWSLPATRVTT